MTKNTATISINEYLGLVDFRKKVIEGEICSLYYYNGQWYLSGFVTESEVVKKIAAENEQLYNMCVSLQLELDDLKDKLSEKMQNAERNSMRSFFKKLFNL